MNSIVIVASVGGCCSWIEVPPRLAVRACRLEKCKSDCGHPIQLETDNAKSNILIDSNYSARIADFGLTSLLRHPSISISVSAPAWGGTPQWMAPELFDGKSRPSKESDIYALGMVIYEVRTLYATAEPVLIDPFRRFSRIKGHSLPFSTTLYLDWSSLESDPRDRRTMTFSVCRRMSGC